MSHFDATAASIRKLSILRKAYTWPEKLFQEEAPQLEDARFVMLLMESAKVIRFNLKFKSDSGQFK